MASSNKTKNVGLNYWSGTDRAKRTDFNNDNKAIDDFFTTIMDDILTTGVVEGGLVKENTNTDLSVNVEALIAYGEGVRLYTNSERTVDCSKDVDGNSTAVKTDGNEKWISLYVTKEEGETIFEVYQGTEAVAGSAEKPSIKTGGRVLLADILLSYGQIKIFDNAIDHKRKINVKVKNTDNQKDYLNIKDFGAVGDGVTDDTQAFLALSNYLINNGGGIVYIPKGEYILNDIFKIPSNTLIFGSGNSTVIKAKEGADDLGTNIALFANADRINGNKNITIKNLKLDIQKDLQTRRNNSLTCLDFYNSEFIKIINVTAEGSIEHEHAPLDTSLEFPAASAAIFFRRTSRSVIENCHVLKSDYDGIALWEASNYNLVKDNYIEQTGYDYTSKDSQSHIGAGIQETSGWGAEICVGNKYINNTVIGYKIVSSSGDILENNCFISHSGLQLLLQGNHFYNSYGDAIRIISHTMDNIKNQLESLYDAPDFTGFTITGNHIENVFKSIHEEDAIAIHINNVGVSKGMGYSNVNISDNVIVNSEGGGIHIDCGYNMTIQGNTLRYINTGNYSDAAIKNRGAANVTIQGNVIADVGDPLRTGYGIYLVDYPTATGTKEPRRNIITGNVMRNSEGFLIESVTGKDPANWNYIETNNIDD